MLPNFSQACRESPRGRFQLPDSRERIQGGTMIAYGPVGVAAALVFLHALSQGIASMENQSPVGPTVTVETSPELERALDVARRVMNRAIGEAAVARSSIEVLTSPGGWIVIFHDANASCGQGLWWPGACRNVPAQLVIRDVFACVDREWRVDGFGSNVNRIGPEARRLCGGAQAAPTASPPSPADAQPITGAQQALPPGGVPVVPEGDTVLLAVGGLFIVAGLRWWRRP